MEQAAGAICAMRVSRVMDEAQLQEQIALALSRAGVDFTREARIGPRCRADFLLDGGVIIEVKAGRRARKDLLAQLSRYAACQTVTAILLVTNAPLHPPKTLGGKPVRVLNLRNLWGVAVN